MELKIVELSDRLTHVKLVGKMNSPGVMEIETEFNAAVAGRLKPTIVDLSEVSFMTSIGVRTLLFNLKALRKEGAKMAMLGPQPAIVKVFEMAGLNLVVPFVSTLEEGLRELGLDGAEPTP
jgi:anti-sigma B factor antagonist